MLARITGAAILLLPFALWSLRGQWRAIRRELPRVALYGTLAVAAAQLGYFQAVSRMDVGIALLIEYLGIVLVVLWVWALTRQRPHRLTVVGIVLALVGLALVLDVTGQSTPPLPACCGAWSPPPAWPVTTCSPPGRPPSRRPPSPGWA